MHGVHVLPGSVATAQLDFEEVATAPLVQPAKERSWGVYQDNKLVGNWTDGFIQAGAPPVVTVNLTKAGFNALVAQSTTKIIRRTCSSCKASHREIYYRRLSTKPWDPFSTLLDTWENSNNVMAEGDFGLYSTYEDAITGRNKWLYCNHTSSYQNAEIASYMGTGTVGFPGDCASANTGVTNDTCEAAAFAFYGAKVITTRRILSGSWDHVPPGCSVAGQVDWAAHWNSNTTARNPNSTFYPVGVRSPSLMQANAITAKKGQRVVSFSIDITTDPPPHGALSSSLLRKLRTAERVVVAWNAEPQPTRTILNNASWVSGDNMLRTATFKLANGFTVVCSGWDFIRSDTQEAGVVSNGTTTEGSDIGIAAVVQGLTREKKYYYELTSLKDVQTVSDIDKSSGHLVTVNGVLRTPNLVGAVGSSLSTTPMLTGTATATSSGEISFSFPKSNTTQVLSAISVTEVADIPAMENGVEKYQ